MEKELKSKLVKKNISFQERLEYLIRDINMIEQDIIHVEHNLADLNQQFEEIKNAVRVQEKKTSDLGKQNETKKS